MDTGKSTTTSPSSSRLSYPVAEASARIICKHATQTVEENWQDDAQELRILAASAAYELQHLYTSFEKIIALRLDFTGSVVTLGGAYHKRLMSQLLSWALNEQLMGQPTVDLSPFRVPESTPNPAERWLRFLIGAVLHGSITPLAGTRGRGQPTVDLPPFRTFLLGCAWSVFSGRAGYYLTCP